MKKSIILCILLSTFYISAAENENENQTETEIRVETHLHLLGTGIVITPDKNGIVSDKIALEHGTRKKDEDSTASRVAYIKSLIGNLPAGLTLQINLIADKLNTNDLVTNSGEKDEERIAHKLSGVVNNAVKLSKNTLEIFGETKEDRLELTTTDELLNVILNSNISGTDMIEKETGNYENTSTMTVKVLAN